MNAVLHTPEQAARWLRGRTPGTLSADSRQVKSGDAFLAWPGAATDARRFVPAVLSAGAAACLVEQAGADAFGWPGDDERIGLYAGLKSAAAPIAAAYFEAPSQAMRLVAVTGTNGKTSTTWWLAQALATQGERCAVVGTLGIGEPGAMVFNGLTTPDPVLLQQQLRRLVNQGFSACAIEASSIGLAEARLDATQLHTAVFTNFTQDHLDYHGSMAEYWQAKARLFDWPGLQAAVVNVDDAQGAVLAQALAAKAIDLWTFSCQGPARLQAVAIGHGAAGMQWQVRESSAAGTEVCAVAAPVVGDYNVANLMGVIGALRSLGVPLAVAAAACARLSPVPGRMDLLAQAGQPLVVIDYAHTPDALAQVLTALRPTAESRGGQLWCVFGCGGDRDAHKRPLMAGVAERGADQLLLTSDNPRSEEPAAIINAMRAGLTRPQAAQVEVERSRAIANAIAQAQPADVILLAGKGHEDYQEVQGVKRPFSDHAQALTALALRRAALQAGGSAA